jgi:hypothetical protein
MKETEETGDLNGNGKIGDVVSQKFDFHGKDGQILNVLSDTGVQVNGRIGGKGPSWFKEIGAQVRGEDGQTYAIRYAVGEKNPSVMMPDGQVVAMTRGETVNLGGGATAVWEKAGNTVSLKTKEYDMQMINRGNHFDLHTGLTDQFDGLNNDGILGITGNLEAIGGVVKNGAQGKNANGEGVATRGKDGSGADRSPEDYIVRDGILGQDTRFNTF